MIGYAVLNVCIPISLIQQEILVKYVDTYQNVMTYKERIIPKCPYRPPKFARNATLTIDIYEICGPDHEHAKKEGKINRCQV